MVTAVAKTNNRMPKKETSAKAAKTPDSAGKAMLAEHPALANTVAQIEKQFG